MPTTLWFRRFWLLRVSRIRIELDDLQIELNRLGELEGVITHGGEREVLVE
jgi:hypothetical protein